MNLNNITLDDIKTKPYRASFLSRNYVPFNDFSGFIKSKNQIILYSENMIEKFKNHESVRLYHVSKEEVEKVKSRYKIKSSYYNTSIITKLGSEYFTLSGKANKEKRNVMNRFNINIPLSIQEHPNSIEEVKLFLKDWKCKRKVKYNEMLMFTGYDLNFIKKYLIKFKDNLITKFYYLNSKLVGFTIIEKVNDNFYNLLIRKVDPSISQLTYYIDYSTFCEIYENTGQDLVVNLGIDGDKGIHAYKTKKFPVCQEIKTYNIKVIFNKG